MRAGLGIVVCLFVAAPAAGHPYSEHGNMTLATFVLPDTPAWDLVYSLLDSIAPAVVLPNGLLWYGVHGVQAGDQFTVKADDGHEPLFPCGPAGCCPGDPEDPIETLGCNPFPDFDVKFTNGAHENRLGDEAGTVPGDGTAVVVLFFGDVGEGFTWSEWAA